MEHDEDEEPDVVRIHSAASTQTIGTSMPLEIKSEQPTVNGYAHAQPSISSSAPPPPLKRQRSSNVQFLQDYSSAGRRVLLLCIYSIIIAVGATFAGFCLLALIRFVSNLCFYGHLSVADLAPDANNLGGWVVLVPIAGSISISLLAHYGHEKVRGHGMPDAMETILYNHSTVSPILLLLKPIGTAFSIGTGAPFGVEGPTILTGGSVGSIFAQFVSVSDNERKTLMVAGAAAATAAIFSAPISAVLISLELLLFELKPRSVVPVSLAACVATILRPLMFEKAPLWPDTFSTPLDNSWGYLGCIIMGLICGVFAVLVTKSIHAIETWFKRTLPYLVWPPVSGLFIGVLGYLFPTGLGPGYPILFQLRTLNLSADYMAKCLVVKALTWSVALGSNTAGGLLAPILIMGGCMGYLFGMVFPTGTVTFWALISMSALMGSLFTAPLSAIVLNMELSGNMSLLLPQLLATATAYLVSTLLQRRSIMTLPLADKGKLVSCEFTADPIANLRVGEVMRRRDQLTVLKADTPVDRVAKLLDSAAADPFLSANDLFPWLSKPVPSEPRPSGNGQEEKRQPEQPESRSQERFAVHKQYPVVDDQDTFLGLLSREHLVWWVYHWSQVTQQHEEKPPISSDAASAPQSEPPQLPLPPVQRLSLTPAQFPLLAPLQPSPLPLPMPTSCSLPTTIGGLLQVCQLQPEKISMQPDDPVTAAIHQLFKHQLRCLPVLEPVSVSPAANSRRSSNAGVHVASLQQRRPSMQQQNGHSVTISTPTPAAGAVRLKGLLTTRDLLGSRVRVLAETEDTRRKFWHLSLSGIHRVP